jgi:CRISPR type I-E-associated protein CasB/Cse2
VHRHLPRLIAHLRADLVAVDWVVLAEDLARWDIERDRVAKEWLQSFHRTLASSRNADTTPSTTSESERS